MRVRLGYWGGGLLVLAILTRLGNRAPRAWEAAPIALLLAWGLLGLAGEVVALIRSARAPTRRAAPPHARPADGRVGVVPMAGVRSQPNPRDPRFRRFVA